MTLGEKIAKRRRVMNYTQEQLAEILGVSRQSISKWESNLAYPETEKLLKMGRLFGCSMDYLLDDTVDQEIGAVGTDASGEKAEPSAPPSAVERQVQPMVGAILLASGLLSIIFGVLFSLLLIGFGVVLCLCGVLCLTVKKTAMAVAGCFGPASGYAVYRIFRFCISFPGNYPP